MLKIKTYLWEIIIKDNDITLEGEVYKGTPGLWELITSKNPTNYTDEDKDIYRQLLLRSNTIYRGHKPNSNYPKSSRSFKWSNIISPLWEEIKTQREYEAKTEEETDEDDDLQPSTSGTGLKILPSDPNALIDRFDLLFSSKKAGHTGVRNEIVSILDELKRQRVINTKEYKKLNSLIKK